MYVLSQKGGRTMICLIKAFYSDKQLHSNAQLYNYFNACNDKRLQHSLRGMQQYLKRKGILKNVAYGIWTA